MNYHIKWSDFARATYSNGSQISFSDHAVLFHNPQMPPGETVTSWSSRTNFQAQRIQPGLPLLRRGRRYRVRLKARVEPVASLYIKVSYYDRFGEKLDFETIKGDQGEFTYPQTAFSYTIDLVNAGCHTLLFEELVLSEEDVQIRHRFPITSLADLETSLPISLILLEPGDTADGVQSFLEAREVVICISERSREQIGYLSSDFEQFISSRQAAGGGKVTLIGYGPVGNFFARYYSGRLQVPAQVTAVMAEPAVYKRIIKEDPAVDQVVEAVLSSAAEDMDQVTLYGQMADIPDLRLVRSLIDYRHQLRYLPTKD